MILTQHDLYDLHAVFVTIRNNPNTRDTYAVIVRLKDLFDKWDHDACFEGNVIRKTLRPAPELDRERYYWVDTDNVYAYHGRLFKPDHPVYPMLRQAFDMLFQLMRAGDSERVSLLADGFHNIPLILCEKNTHIRRRVEQELTSVRRMLGAQFLREELKNLPR